MRMVDSMEASYSMHGHTRSLSSLASTILPVASDASTYTSVTASPMEPHDLDGIPIELKIPLPSSSCCSEQDLQAIKEESGSARTNKSTNEKKSQDDSKSHGYGSAAHTNPEDEAKNDVILSETPGPTIVSLKELAQLVDLEHFQRYRATSAMSQMNQLSIACGLNRRLSSTMAIAYGNLIDQYKGDDQAGFAGLYESVEKLKKICNLQVQSAGAKNKANNSDFTGEFRELEKNQPWIQQLPAGDQKSVLRFLTRIRTNPDYLADRIASLSPSELAALTSSYHPAGVDLSVLANHSHGMTQFYSQDSQMMKLSRRMDNLQHFHDQDPFFTLMYCLFDTTAKAGSQEYACRNNVWSSVCAKVIMDRRPGGDELIIAAADAFMSFEEWKLKPQIEVFLQTVLTEGSFLLDQSSSTPPAFNESVESKNATYAIKVANFFDKALGDLFDLIASVPHKEALPKTAQDFVQATTRKIRDTQLQLKAKQFFISRWFFASFLSSALVYPELQGLLMTHHIGDSARQNILKQIVFRMQAQVFDVLLSRADDMLVTLQRRVQILAISGYFEPSSLDDSPRQPKEDSCIGSDGESSILQVMLSPRDFSGLVHTLYPSNPTPEDTGSLTVPQASAPPSTTSSSTLRPGSSDVSSSASSMGPNYSGSSINSEATITGNNLPPPQATIDRLSHELSRNGDGDPNELASRLWIIHSKLQAIARDGIDHAAESTRSAQWAIFPILSNGAVSLPTPTALPGLVLSNQSALQVDGSVPEHRILKEAIMTLLRTQGYGIHPTETSQDRLKLLLEKALANAQLAMDFGAAHHWARCKSIFSSLADSSNGRNNNIQDLLNEVGRELRRSVEIFTKNARTSERNMRSLSFMGQHQKASLSIRESERRALRIKMWYTSDVRHSSTYEEASLVTKALRKMANSKRNKQPGSTFSWARQRLRGAVSQDRAEAQAFEAMIAPKDCGGRSKLADDQVEMTSRWLTRSGVENFCKGEERMHRFCYEVQKSVGKLAGASLLESPVLWSSHLFRRDKAAFDARTPRPSIAQPPGLHTPLGSFIYGGNRTSSLSAQHGIPPLSTPINVGAHASGLGYSLGFSNSGHNAATPPSGSPAATSTMSSMQIYHSTETNTAATRPGARHDPDNDPDRASSKIVMEAKEALVKDVRVALCGLLVSDLGYLLWNTGSETDMWVNKAAAEEQIYEKSAPGTVRSSLEVHTGETQQNNAINDSTVSAGSDLDNQERSNWGSGVRSPNFSFPDAYRVLLHRMSMSYDPFIKLEMIYQLEGLVVQSTANSSRSGNGTEASPHDHASVLQVEPMVRSKSVPRTKATSLEEVVANCTERRAGTLQTAPSLNDIASTDSIVNNLLAIFRDHQLRPANLFLSLQYIAAFIPAHVLDHTAHGKAFWDCSLAALALKEDLCNSTVRRAAEITNAYITSKPTSPPYPPQQEAANLWLVAAKEGSPVAARELGLFYLTHPDLLPQRVTMPLFKSKDVFKSSKPGDGGASGERPRGALDPLTFDVVYHWMEIAANGGDAEASAFLRQGGSG